jgi:hypothetical protein
MILARCNGVEVVRRDGEVWIVVARPAPPTVALFVIVLVAGITLANAIVQGMLGHGVAAAILAAVGAVAAWLAVMVRRFGRRRAAAEPTTVLILDVAHARLLDPQRRELAPLASVRVARKMQLGSSSSALALRWPAGGRVIARGSPFGDAVDDCEAALRAQGVASG